MPDLPSPLTIAAIGACAGLFGGLLSAAAGAYLNNRFTRHRNLSEKLWDLRRVSYSRMLIAIIDYEEFVGAAEIAIIFDINSDNLPEVLSRQGDKSRELLSDLDLIQNQDFLIASKEIREAFRSFVISAQMTHYEVFLAKNFSGIAKQRSRFMGSRLLIDALAKRELLQDEEAMDLFSRRTGIVQRTINVFRWKKSDAPENPT